MKKLFLLLLISALCFSCSADEDQTSPDLIGQWKLVSTSGGFAGNTQTPDPNDLTIIEFTSDNVYKEIRNGDVSLETTYDIEKGKSIRSTEEVELIVFEEGVTFNKSFEINESTLVLYDECHDCFQHTYIKISNQGE